MADIESLVVKADKGTPVLIRDIARVELVPDERRGVTELNGEGEVVSGIAVARYGQNALEVIHNLKEKIAEVSTGLPQGVTIAGGVRPLRPDSPGDRNAQAHTDRRKPDRRAGLRGLSDACALSALVAILMFPVGVLMAFIAMRLLGMNSNLMSLGGIAIAIGAMVDAAIVMIENAHKHLERLPEEHTNTDRVEAMIGRLQGGGPGFVLLAAHHHRVLPAGVHAGSRRKAACSRHWPIPKPLPWPVPRYCR